MSSPEALLDTVLAALAAHRPDAAPLSPNVRFTENGQPLVVGDGMWRTLTRFVGDGGAADERLSPYRVVLADPDGENAVFFGATLETGTPGMLMLRVRAANGLVSEIEAVAVRLEIVGERGGSVTMFQPRLLTPFDPAGFAQADPALTAPARGDGDLAATAGSWFNAIAANDPNEAPIAAGCVARDNGIKVAGDPAAPPLNPDMPAYRPFALDLKAQIASGFFRPVSGVRGVRHLAVDPARGLVASVVLKDYEGRLRQIDVPGIGPVPVPGTEGQDDQGTPDQLFGSRLGANWTVPTTTLTAQITRIDGGEITRIEAISRGAPYGLTNGW